MSPRRPTRRTRNPASSPAVWIAARARNALRRPAFIGTVSVITFLLALLALIVVPQQARKAASALRPTAARPDTEPTVVALGVAEREVTSADSAISAARAELSQLIAATAEAVAADTLANGAPLSANVRIRRDTLTEQVASLGRLLTRAENAPLLGSYRALAEAPAMQGDVRVKQLLDSLVEIERERESYNAVGGVDPVFVALTARANDLGRNIQALAELRRNALQKELATIAPPPPAIAAVAARPLPDTLAKIRARDTARTVAAEVAARLARERAELARLDAQEERARELAGVGASPSAILAAALIFGAMIGFGVALFDEVRRPRVSDAFEVERATGARVLGVIRPVPPSPERGRRAADRAAPPYIDPGSEGHQLVYLSIATAGSSVVMATITGDSPAVSAVVGVNFAAIAADEARGTLLVDTDSASSAVASALQLRPSAGLSAVLAGDTPWSEAIRAARIGRDRVLEVMPSGRGAVNTDQLTTLLQRDAERLTRRYDAVVLVSTPEQVLAGTASALPVANVVYCARAGRTPVAELQKAVAAIQETGAQLRGVVLWSAPDPALGAVRAEKIESAKPIIEAEPTPV